jgi:hypothetical protein
MKNSKLIFFALLNSLGTFVYVFLVVSLISNAQKLFGQPGNFWGPVALLSLFVLSATIVGLLVLGRPGFLYFDGFKKEGVALLVYTIVFLLIITMIIFSTLAIIKTP